jgi:huntingtin
VKAPTRDARQHVTVTVVIYNTVAGGVPGFEDVAAAVADMDALYASCGWTGALASEGANFMKSELTVGDALKIADKVAAQPYKPDNMAPENGDLFPTAAPPPNPNAGAPAGTAI